MNEAKPGDIVRITTFKEQIEGILLESFESGILLIKLKSGYNIGIKKEDITNIELIKKTEKEEKKYEVKEKKNLPYVDIIITGGTLSSRVDYKTGGVKWLTKPEELFKFYPEIFDIVNVRKIEIPFMKASENMCAEDWKKIAEICEKSLNEDEVKGVIITHGTDFLHYTSAALSFFLRDLNKPVVLTYSQRSSDRASSDASLNLKCAAYASISDIAEVMLVGHASSNDDFCYVMPGTKVRKMHTSKRDAFKVINSKPFAKIFPDGKIEKISSHNIRDDKKKVRLDNEFNDKVALLKFYPGQDPEILDYYIKKYHGVVIEASGLGHVAVSEEAKHDWLPKIKKAIDNGLVVCMACQTIYGRLNPLVYSPGRALTKAGVIFLEDMLPETAFVKLGWVLGHKNWKDKIKEKMLEPIAKEINERLEE
ncbi:MAG: Glu-tRNA(Gln) amidotransferase subunit GatD [Candidatus Pacearchaeota archaeon]